MKYRHFIFCFAVVLCWVAPLRAETIQGSCETLRLGDETFNPFDGSQVGFNIGYHLQPFAEFNVPANPDYTSGTFELTVMPQTWPPVQDFSIGLTLTAIRFQYDGPLLFIPVGTISGTPPQIGQSPEVFSTPVTPEFLALLDAGGAIGVTAGVGGLITPSVDARDPTLILTSPTDGVPLPAAVWGGLLLLGVVALRLGSTPLGTPRPKIADWPRRYLFGMVFVSFRSLLQGRRRNCRG